ncbi:MAG: hypothetical protein IT406_01045 [Candidatus Yanofskybacteria bacterium]|nr:hypothetical protein [Candidatus Yanofskybacteria bacterium]
MLSWAAAVLSQFEGHTWYDVVSYGLAVPLLALVPGAAYRRTIHLAPRWREIMDRLAFALLVITAPATVKLHAMGFQYDRFLHFAAAALSLGVVVCGVAAFRPVMLRRGARVIALAASILFVGLFVWEGHQYTADRLFGTQLFHDANQSIVRDFWEDIGFGILGIVTGSAILARYRNRFPELIRVSSQ